MPEGVDKVDNHGLLTSLFFLAQWSQEQCTERSCSIASETQIEPLVLELRLLQLGFFVI